MAMKQYHGRLWLPPIRLLHGYRAPPQVLQACAADAADWRDVVSLTQLKPGHAVKLRNALRAGGAKGQWSRSHNPPFTILVSFKNITHNERERPK